MAGYPITAAAERAPERIARLVYLCAYVPWPGRSLADMRRLAPRQPLLAGDPHRRGPRQLSLRSRPGAARSSTTMSSPGPAPGGRAARRAADVRRRRRRWRSAGRRTVPRSYIRCRDDRAVPPEFQDTMTEGWPEGTVFDLPSSHSPFLSMPDRLAAVLHAIAAALRVVGSVYDSGTCATSSLDRETARPVQRQRRDPGDDAGRGRAGRGAGRGRADPRDSPPPRSPAPRAS